MVRGIVLGTVTVVFLVAVAGIHPLLAYLVGAATGVYAAVASEHRRW